MVSSKVTISSDHHGMQSNRGRVPGVVEGSCDVAFTKFTIPEE
jgi:hypothetical protein